MKKYTIKHLNEKDTDTLFFIAKIHEQLPAAWIEHYEADPETITNTAEELVRKLTDNRMYCAVIEDHTRVLSYIWAEVNADDHERVDIMSLWTDENFRGRGLAGKLKADLERWAKQDVHAKTIQTTVSTTNEKMINLNEKLGYRTRYVRMVKDL